VFISALNTCFGRRARISAMQKVFLPKIPFDVHRGRGRRHLRSGSRLLPTGGGGQGVEAGGGLGHWSSFLLLGLRVVVRLPLRGGRPIRSRAGRRPSAAVSLMVDRTMLVFVHCTPGQLWISARSPSSPDVLSVRTFSRCEPLPVIEWHSSTSGCASTRALNSS
jgi:hypothetical protein